ncbi:MAG: hypothetical protein E7598_07220, partial [Ruminococcaceae bacterium]|nr:hypothetical protein [Oscillospiraceae bacterium]
MSKKFLSVLLTLCMLLSMFPVVLPVSAEETAAEVIEIGTAAELVALMGKEEVISGSYKLTNDINLTDVAGQAPIGISADYHFTGTFDGDGYTISGINISGTNYAALFGYIRDAEIKNLNVSGAVSGVKYVGGLIGYAHQAITITNCSSDVDVTATGQYVGGIIGLLRNTNTNNAAVTGCQNTGDVTSSADTVGGIIGYHYGHGTGTVVISGCKNTGTISSTYTDNAANVGGIVGKSDQKAGPVTITQCLNEGDVSGYFHVGGIIGLFTGQDVNATTENYSLTECKNTGAISTTRTSNSYTGGIAGQISNVGNISDCLNTGTVSAKGTYVGGLFGGQNSSISKYFGAAYCLNKTAVTSEKGTADYINSIGGYLPAKPIGNCYYYGTIQGKVWENGDAKSTQYTADCFEDLNTNGKWVIAEEPELAVFHTHNYAEYETVGIAGHQKVCACGAAEATEAHVDEDTNGTCDICGGVTACNHEGTEKTYELVSVSTCSTKGVEKEICSCGSETGATRELELDATNHEAIDYVWQKDGETYYYACAACGVRVVEQTEKPTVYVDALGQADPHIGTDTASGTASDEVLTITEAVRRIANVGGTVCLTDRYYISGVVELPAYAEPITITSLVNGTSGKTGFYAEAATRLILGGDTAFEYIYFFSDNNKAKEFVFQANWNNLTFGDEIATGVTGYIIAGTTGMTADDTAPAETTITVSGVNEYSKGNGENITFETIPTFYNKVFLGNRITTSASLNENGYTVDGKKVTLVANDGVGYPSINDVYLITSSPVATPLVATTNCETTITLNGTSTIVTLMSGYKNTDDGEGYLDKFVLNLNDNSDVLKYYTVKNVKNIEMNVSTGRTTKATSPIFTKGNGYTPDGTETIVANYGEHSFAKTALADGFIQGAHYNAMYAGRVITNIAKECTFDEGVITTPAAPGVTGVKTFTCSECGRTTTEDVAYVCTEHIYVAKADGTLYCANGCDNVTAPAGNTVTASTAVLDDGTVAVTLTANITDPLVAATLYVTAPEGFALDSVLAGEAVKDITFEGATDLTKNPYKIGFIDTTLTDKAIVGTLATLNYTKDAELEDGAYVFVVAIDEAYNVDEDVIAITGIGSELAVAAEEECTHENKTTTSTATCTEGGVETTVCDDCGET